MRPRRFSDEHYVLDLCDEILAAKGFRGHRFDWLSGDPGATGRRALLPVDSYYAGLGLVIEYRERQHDEPVAFFDRRKTISGVGRGEQRQRYDDLRDEQIPKHGLRLLVVRPRDLDADKRGRLRRTRNADLAVLAALLRKGQGDALDVPPEGPG